MIVAFVKLDEQNKIFTEKYNIKKTIFNINNLWWYMGLGVAAIVTDSQMSSSGAIVLGLALIGIAICMVLAFISMIVNLFTATYKINFLSDDANQEKV